MSKIIVHHFSDILCIWAYVSEIRIQELKKQFADQVEVDFCLFPVFGDVPGKMKSGWEDKGGVAAYAEHVRSIAAEYEHTNLHEDIWKKTVPYSSLPAHLHLAAVKIAENENDLPAGAFPVLASRIRDAFFQEALDISDSGILESVIIDAGYPIESIIAAINNGHAYAELSRDMQTAKEKNVRSSPTLIFNEDRQRLTGNVGYRMIEANVRELLERPQLQHSWC